MYGVAVTLFVIICLGVVGIIVWKKRAAILMRDEKLMQLYFRADHAFVFRKLKTHDRLMVHKRGERYQGAWPDLNQLRLPFAGGMGIKKCQVTICYARDVVFDPFKELHEGTLKRTSKAAYTWLSGIALNRAEVVKQASSRKIALGTQAALMGGAVLILAVTVMVVVLV